jgi:hypothetical protein
MYKLSIKGNNSHQNSFSKTSWKVIKIKKQRQNRYTISHFLAGWNDLIRSNVKKGNLV